MLRRTVQAVQHDFGLSSGLRSEIIWDSLPLDQPYILKQKIETLLPGTDKNQKYIEKYRKTLFENIWRQRIYTNRVLLSAIIYILVTEEREEHFALQSAMFSVHPVFRTRKCINENNSAGCCMIFIDEHGRVYMNWKQYLMQNKLPKGTMITPKNGIYTFNDINEVELEFHLTPAARTKSKILKTTDTVVGVGGLAATVPLAAALAYPIAAPVMAAATVIAVSTAAYSTVRSAMQLTDRYGHGQSNSLADREARNNWIGVAGGVVGIGATGATKALTYAATAGQEITLAAKLAVSGINVSSIVLSGTGIVNSVYDLYLKVQNDEKLSAMDVMQLASSLVVFTHSINNLIIASKVTTGNRSLISNELSKKISEIVNKITGKTPNKLDIIRTVNDIPIKDALLSLHKTNTNLRTRRNEGQINEAIPFNILPSNLIDIFRNTAEINIPLLAAEFGPKFVQHISNIDSLLDVMNAMAQYLCESVFRFLIQLSKTFIEQNVDSIERNLNTYVSTETVLYKMLMHCVQNYTNLSYQFLESKTCEIFMNIENYFNSLNPVNYRNEKRNCKDCNGFFYICNL